MGEVAEVLPQGPEMHCGKEEYHDRHPHLPISEVDGYKLPDHAWCSGVPVLGSFVELTVRVPLTGVLDMGNATHEQVVAAISGELGTFIWDQVGEPGTRCGLRLRWGGQDRMYPLRVET